MTGLLTVIGFALALAAAVLLLIFILVPLFKGLGWLIGATFKGIGWLVVHVFDFIGGMLGDTLRFVGAVIALLVLAPLAFTNLLIGRWSAAGHFADSVTRECKVAGACVYRVALRRPLKLLLLDGLLEGVEQRVPEAWAAAPTSDRPSRRSGTFPGYTIVGSLRGGGSGAKLYIAEPEPSKRARYAEMPDRVVIKSFRLSEGSTLPQILRESRALESAKQLGLVFDHGMDQHHFHYVMPYHAGDHLGIVTRQLHGENDGKGLEPRQLATALDYVADLVQTLAVYHRGGLWHKDVKPENIIVHSGRAHLVDLGLVTPLGSAMTLTTHGTEYFRDPELVRQALRGVKVHQVNGAKFDIYAAGAVLYFMIENTFPAHGALSRFHRHGPDALRWIVRRAMADYAHRYETAEAMLADLRHVASAADPFTVRPADLPSMSGRAAALEDSDLDLAPEPAVAAAAASAVPPAGADTPPPLPRAAAQVTARPGIEVTNWWTGAYRVTDAGGASMRTAASPVAEGSESLRRHAAAMRGDASDLRRKVRSGAMTARRAAREQVRNARRRARDMQRRARTHRKAVAERQPSMALGVIALVFLLAIGGVVAWTLRDHGGGNGARASAARPVLLVPRPDVLSSPEQVARTEEIAADYRRRGYDVIVDRRIVDQGLGDALERWYDEPDGVNDAALEDVMETLNVWGLLVVHEGGRHGIVRSTRAGAAERTYVAGPPPSSSRPYLLINDHPSRFDPEVARQVSQYLDQFRVRGWNLVTDESIEVAVRKALPVGALLGPDAALPRRAAGALRDAEIGGVVYVYAPDGAGPARSRVALRMIEAGADAEVGLGADADAEAEPEDEAWGGGAEFSGGLESDGVSHHRIAATAGAV